MNYTINAQGKKLGRIATEAATVLMGKNDPSFAKNVAGDGVVEIINASKIDLTEKKRKEKSYAQYSGYPDGLKMIGMNSMISKHGIEGVVRKAVRGMMPSNKLRPLRLKRLIVTE
ncbi:MAG: 50S ribosomal protein L13 [Parcubacteria group bacterium CG11_big_fil_rev_8_21_14_0_20_39_22]|nr:MAG: 50S ribosomal protein L13 [Parcubacteria group bacterium CG11_big_fil_rev_8_21_14_0_20_39_22]